MKKNYWWLLGLAVLFALGFLAAACHSAAPNVASGKNDTSVVENPQTDSRKGTSFSKETNRTPDDKGISYRETESDSRESEEIVPYSEKWFQTHAPSALLTKEEKVKDLEQDTSENTDPEKYRLFVDVSNQLVIAYEKNSEEPVRIMPCSTGKDGFETTGGTFFMGEDKRRFGYFESFDCYAQYWSQIQGEIYLHSVLYSKQDENTLIEDSFENIGEAVSHGCVRLYVPDAKWIYYHCPPGTEVEVDIAHVDRKLQKAVLTGREP